MRAVGAPGNVVDKTLACQFCSESSHLVSVRDICSQGWTSCEITSRYKPFLAKQPATRSEAGTRMEHPRPRAGTATVASKRLSRGTASGDPTSRCKNDCLPRQRVDSVDRVWTLLQDAFISPAFTATMSWSSRVMTKHTGLWTLWQQSDYTIPRCDSSVNVTVMERPVQIVGSDSVFEHLQIISLSLAQTRKLQQLRNERVFNLYSSSNGVGRTTRIKHEIKLKNETPFKERRGTPPSMCEQEKNNVSAVFLAVIFLTGMAEMICSNQDVLKPSFSCLQVRKSTHTSVAESWWRSLVVNVRIHCGMSWYSCLRQPTSL